MDAAVADHGLSRARLSVRLPEPQHLRLEPDDPDGAVDRDRAGPSAHGHHGHAGQAGHRAPRPQIQEHPRQAERGLLYRRPRSGRAP